MYRTRFQGFTARHFHEHLVRDHRYSWTKAFLQSRNLLPKAERRGAHRRKRPRRPLPGMMLHQSLPRTRSGDASRHAWLAEGPLLDLVVTMDDATSEICSAFLIEEEGTDSTFLALLEVFDRNGLPLSLYTDRGSHYFHTSEAGGKVDRGELTQVGRALAHLGVEHIAAYSPQARGRSERLGYARVSTYGQTLDAQLEQLRAEGCTKIYREKASGAQADRRELLRLLKALASGDVVTVTRIDRLARSTFDLFAIVKRIVDVGGQFRSLAESWADTGISTGRLMIAVLGGLADVERDLFRTRTAEGRSRAKACGQHMGRPPKLNPPPQAEARRRRAQGATLKDLAKSYNVAVTTISKLGA